MHDLVSTDLSAAYDSITPSNDSIYNVKCGQNIHQSHAYTLSVKHMLETPRFDLTEKPQ